MRAASVLQPDLVLTNARVLTMDPRHPTSQSVAVRGDRIVWAGSDAELPSLTSTGTKVIDCGGGTLIPGFHDAHIHILAYASTMDSVECSPRNASSVADVVDLIATRTARTLRGEWVSAWGYDPFYLAERRHPTRWELDRAAPEHPVRLIHHSGHACVLNSLAMERVGIGEDTDEPPGATIARDLETGSPNGQLLEMEDFLDARIPRPPASDLSTLVGRASRRLLSLGVTSVQDATHNNSTDRWNLFKNLLDQGMPMPRITLMPGADHITEFADAGLSFGSGSNRLRTGHAKIMVTASTGVPMPSLIDLKTTMRRCTSLGFPVAAHAVEDEVVRSVAEAISESPTLPGRRPPHRIEHCSETPPEVLEQVVECGASVITQPGFVYNQGDRYLAEVSPAMQRYLYRAASLVSRGVMVAFSSDAPVCDPDPVPGLYAAITRRTSSGNLLSGHEGMGIGVALSAYTVEPARVTGVHDRLGRIASGSLADMVLFDEDLLTVEPDALLGIRPVMTILGGRVAWEG